MTNQTRFLDRNHELNRNRVRRWRVRHQQETKGKGEPTQTPNAKQTPQAPQAEVKAT